MRSELRWIFLQIRSEAKTEDNVQRFLSKLHNIDPRPISYAKLVTVDSNGEVRQGLGRIWFVNPNASNLWVADCYLMLHRRRRGVPPPPTTLFFFLIIIFFVKKKWRILKIKSS